MHWPVGMPREKQCEELNCVYCTEAVVWSQRNHVRLLVDKVALEQLSNPAFGFSPSVPIIHHRGDR
jgi:hypothetical protein